MFGTQKIKFKVRNFLEDHCDYYNEYETKNKVTIMQALINGDNLHFCVGEKNKRKLEKQKEVVEKIINAGGMAAVICDTGCEHNDDYKYYINYDVLTDVIRYYAKNKKKVG